MTSEGRTLRVDEDGDVFERRDIPWWSHIRTVDSFAVPQAETEPDAA